MDVLYTFFAIIIVATVTGLIRSAPFLVFGGKKELPNYVQYLGYALPPAIMVILVVYCLRNIEISTFPFGLAEIISVVLIIIIQTTKKNTFLSILIGTTIYMVLIRTVLSI